MQRFIKFSLVILACSVLGAAWGHPIDNIPSPSLALSETLKTYISLGVHHIFTGFDHILFVIGLILAGGKLRQLLRIITAFTIAHSITLTLAVLNIFAPPSRVIEPLIALSIVCIGVDNIFNFKQENQENANVQIKDWRPMFAFGFGLIHGFGFAGALQEFGLPRTQLIPALISFNGGVEIGQAIIVVSIAPILAWIAKKSLGSRKKVIIIGSIIISLAGLFWFVQRILTVPI
jgi:hydrogenase/urease accessory protein HupE